MKHMRKYLSLFLLLLLSIVALTPVFAHGAGLVVCDPSIPIPQPGSCDICALLKTIQKVFEWIIGLVFIGATGILVYNGVLFYSSQGNPGNVKKILDNIKNVVIGIIIVMASFIFVNTILNWFAAPGSIPTFWNNIECAPGAGIPLECSAGDAKCESNAAYMCDEGTWVKTMDCPFGCDTSAPVCLLTATCGSGTYLDYHCVGPLMPPLIPNHLWCIDFRDPLNIHMVCKSPALSLTDKFCSFDDPANISEPVPASCTGIGLICCPL
ncbi:MAG: hypothetical protein UX65_C0004G0058 [Parcubacteria group bacterium GW2011_GWB1_46_8]|nr:MAG: hypothetical protein UX14_C0002G0026 [Parcubacteria group bacterium GW2011_GWF1_45_5]KKU11261.1 MAG: hypothetical protein UX15_C0012G0018 [Parcubacteria group bacterium GW2011_GWA1_45_7]KKU46412.1 MAG: hypothetical protein UX65_C0004G0058 [Parcubacteria group bacterium GW2011_GWB1_46_8]KKU47516.1 MAG: hypothetical protein UX66_C0011G0010 [Parcubacteria group bacterium GW2011_GWF2_46_8]